MQCAVCSVLCSAMCAVCSVQFAVSSVQCAVCSVKCAVFSVWILQVSEVVAGDLLSESQGQVALRAVHR